MRRKGFTRVLAAAVVGLTLLSVTSCGKANDPAKDYTNGGAFDFEKSNLSTYIRLVGNSTYTGQTVDASSLTQTVYKDADMDDKMKILQYQNRKLLEDSVKSAPIGLGDDVYLYILSAMCEGTDISSFLYSSYGKPYTNSVTATVGMGYFGADFDEKLIGLMPKDTYISQNTEVKELTPTDVVCMTYSFNGGKDKGPKTRVARSSLSKEVREALLENFTGCGRTISFKLNDKDYTATVHYVAKEVTKKITFRFEDDYFTSSAGDTLLACNGKEATFEVVLLYFNDYELPEWNAAFVKDTLGYKTDKTADAEVVQDYRAYLLKTLNETEAENYRKNREYLVWQTVYGKAYDGLAYASGNLPQDAFAAEYQEVAQSIRNDYYANYKNYYSSIDAYCQAQTGGQMTFNQFAQYKAQENVRVDLLMYWIFRAEGLTITEEEVEAAYNEYIQNAIESYQASAKEGDETVYDEAYVLSQWNEDSTKAKEQVNAYLRKENLIYEKVTDFLFAHNTIKDTAEK